MRPLFYQVTVPLVFPLDLSWTQLWALYKPTWQFSGKPISNLMVCLCSRYWPRKVTLQLLMLAEGPGSIPCYSWDSFWLKTARRSVTKFATGSMDMALMSLNTLLGCHQLLMRARIRFLPDRHLAIFVDRLFFCLHWTFSIAFALSCFYIGCYVSFSVEVSFF
jgi:hypothetical protein